MENFIETLNSLLFEEQEDIHNRYINEFKRLLKESRQDDVYAQFQLGMAYYYGHGVEKNDKRAIEWWLKVSEKGFKDADYCIGCINFDQGEYRTAVDYFFRVIENPCINEGAYLLGVIYEEGLGVDKDKEKAIKFYKKGARGRNTASFLSTEALKRIGVIKMWSELGYDYHEIIENAQYRLNKVWDDLIIPFYIHSERQDKFYSNDHSLFI